MRDCEKMHTSLDRKGSRFMGGRPGIRKKRHFYGNQYTKKLEAELNTSASAKKLKLSTPLDVDIVEMNCLPMHNSLKSLSWLEGTWRTETPAEGGFPTIKQFAYHDEVKFTSIGQPMLNYEAQSWHAEKKNPMHREVGFLKIIPDTNKVVLVLSHNFGLTSIEEGVASNGAIELQSTSISRMSEGTKDPAVTMLKREFRLVGENLEQILYMATSTTPSLTKHLHAKYVKQPAQN